MTHLQDAYLPALALNSPLRPDEDEELQPCSCQVWSLPCQVLVNLCMKAVNICVQELNRRLRQEQDDEYQRSLLADQEREQKRSADREAEQARQLAAQQALDAERYVELLLVWQWHTPFLH